MMGRACPPAPFLRTPATLARVSYASGLTKVDHMDALRGIRKDIRQLISINERIQSDLAQGGSLTADEAAILRECANELLLVAQQGLTSEDQVANDGGA